MGFLKKISYFFIFQGTVDNDNTVEIITAGPPTSYLNNHQGITEGSSGGNFVVGQSFSFGVGSKEIEDELEAPTSAAGIFSRNLREKINISFRISRNCPKFIACCAISQTKMLLLLCII